MTTLPDYYQATETTPPGDSPHIEATFLNWLHGFDGKYVARVRLKITGKTKKRTLPVSLRRVSRIVGDGDLNFAVFSIGTGVPPRWRTDALSITHSVIAKQRLHELRKQQEGTF